MQNKTGGWRTCCTHTHTLESGYYISAIRAKVSVETPSEPSTKTIALGASTGRSKKGGAMLMLAIIISLYTVDQFGSRRDEKHQKTKQKRKDGARPVMNDLILRRVVTSGHGFTFFLFKFAFIEHVKSGGTPGHMSKCRRGVNYEVDRKRVPSGTGSIGAVVAVRIQHRGTSFSMLSAVGGQRPDFDPVFWAPGSMDTELSTHFFVLVCCPSVCD
jgi:hypothetical protein